MMNRRNALTSTAALAMAAGLPLSALAQKKIVLGFSQIGAESEWRTANTESIKQAAKDAGIELKFADAQQLRALVRQARKDIKAGPPGEAPRQAKAYREVFQLVRAQLAVHGTADHAAEAAAQSREEDA